MRAGRAKKAKTAIPAFSIYGERLEKPALRFLNVEDLAATNRIHGWHIRAHRHRDLFQLLLIDSGRGEAFIDDVTVFVTAPAFLAIPSQVVHGFRFDSNSTGTILSIAEPFLQDLLRVTGDAFISAAVRSATLRELTDEEFRTLGLDSTFTDIVEEMQRDMSGKTTIVAAKILELLTTLARLIAMNPTAFPGEHSAASKLFDAFCDLVERNFDKMWSINDYASSLNTTERTLRRIVRRIADERPLDIVHRRKLIEAKRQLVYTRVSIAEVAYSLGFGDSSHFTSFFSRHVGVTPVSFRKKYLFQRE